MTSLLPTIDLAALCNITGGAGKTVLNGVEYGPGTYINGVKVDSGQSSSGGVQIQRNGNSISIVGGNNNTVVISQ